MRSAFRAVGRSVVVLALAATGLVVVAGTASAVSTGCASLNSASVDGVYNNGTASGDFEAGEALTFEVGDSIGLLAGLEATNNDLVGELGYLPTIVTVTAPGTMVFPVTVSGHYSLAWSVPLAVVTDPSWAVSCNSDSDADGISDDLDNCPQVANPDQADVDNDGRGDLCDAVNDDVDGDGIENDSDNCRFVANPDQEDVDGDGAGDACDEVNDDVDADGVFNEDDNCLNEANPGQEDADGDGLGDACDAVNDDVDADGVFNELDNCPNVANPGQADIDGDGLGNACDPVNDNDLDGDGISNEADNCPNEANSNQADIDGDGVGDACDAVNDDIDGDGVFNEDDNCPNVANASQADIDGDGLGNACDPVNDNDLDGDGISNEADNCPNLANPTQTNTDGDGLGNACDTDDDNDGVADSVDACPTVYGTRADGCNNSAPTVQINSPGSSALVDPRAAGLITATATDDVAVTSVIFTLGSRTLCVDRSAPYVCAWTPQETEVGTRVITATARDGFGSSAQATRTVQINRFKPALRVKVRKVGKTRPKVKTVGTLNLPSGTTVANACSGVVTVRVKVGRKATVSKVAVKARASRCFFDVKAPMAKRNAKVTVLAKYSGNQILMPVAARGRA